MENKKNRRICLIDGGNPYDRTPGYRYGLWDKLIKKHNADIILVDNKTKKEGKTNLKNYYYFKTSNFLYKKRGVCWKLFSFLKKKKYDIVIACDTTSAISLVCLIMKKILHFKLIVFDELWTYPKTLKAKVAWPLIKSIIRNSDAHVVAGTRSKLFFKTLTDPGKIFISFDSAEDLSKKPIKRLNIKGLKIKNKKVILYLSRIVKYKGLDYLIRAFARLEKENKNVFLLIGGEGSFEEYCKVLAKKLKIKNIKFVGYVNYKDAPSFYKACNIFVLPTRFLFSDIVPSEAWGLVLNEAMSMSKPVISTTAVAGAYDLVKQGKNGFMVKERNVDELYKAMKNIINNPVLERKMGKESKKIVKERFNYDNMLEGFIKATNYVNHL